MSAVLENFASAQPDGIFLPLFAAEGYHFVSQAKEFDKLEEVTLIAGSTTSTQEFLGKPESEGVYLSGHDSDLGTNANQVTGKDARALSAVYKAAADARPCGGDINPGWQLTNFVGMINCHTWEESS